MLQDALTRDFSRPTAGAALPALRTIATARAGTDGELIAANRLAQALDRIDPAAAARQWEQVLAVSLDRSNYRTACSVASYLVYSRLRTGRLTEALQLAEDTAGYTRQAGYGPWTQLNDQVRRLQVLNAMGKTEQVLTEVRQLRDHMATLPIPSQQKEAASPFNVREGLLDTGNNAARRLGRWEESLEFNAAQLASMTARGAPQRELAYSRFNDYGPLLRLGRLDEAVNLLRLCRQVFEETQDIQMLGKVLGALADAEAVHRHLEVALSLGRDALRYSYLAGEVEDIQVSHHNLGNYLRRSRQPGALAHHLAAAVLSTVTGMSGAESSVTGATEDLRADGEATVPADVAELCRLVDGVPGVRLDQLLARLTDLQTAENVLRELIARAGAGAAAAPSAATTVRWLAWWDPVISGLAAAAQGNTEAAEAVRGYLTSYEGSADWAALAGALQHVLDGDREREDLATGLDQIDTAIVIRTLSVLAGQASIPAALWPAMSLGFLLGDITAAAEGDQAAVGRARQSLNELAADPDSAGLAAALGQILDGARDPALPATLTGATDQAVVASVLAHVTATPNTGTA